MITRSKITDTLWVEAKDHNNTIDKMVYDVYVILGARNVYTAVEIQDRFRSGHVPAMHELLAVLDLMERRGLIKRIGDKWA